MGKLTEPQRHFMSQFKPVLLRTTMLWYLTPIESPPENILLIGPYETKQEAEAVICLS